MADLSNMPGIDHRTGRPFGDHGTAIQALDFALDDPCCVIKGDVYNMQDFLRAWREGSAFEWYPEFYDWIAS